MQTLLPIKEYMLQQTAKIVWPHSVAAKILADANKGIRVAQVILGGLMAFVAIGLCIYAFQMGGFYTAYLYVFALGMPGLFIGFSGLRKLEVACCDLEQQTGAKQKAPADAKTIASEAIERARKK